VKDIPQSPLTVGSDIGEVMHFKFKNLEVAKTLVEDFRALDLNFFMF